VHTIQRDRESMFWQKQGWLLFDSFITQLAGFVFQGRKIQFPNELYDTLGTVAALTKDDDDIMIWWQKCRITGPSAAEPQTPVAPWHGIADSAVVRTVIISKASRVIVNELYEQSHKRCILLLFLHEKRNPKIHKIKRTRSVVKGHVAPVALQVLGLTPRGS
jgi:hypothetical protein